MREIKRFFLPEKCQRQKTAERMFVKMLLALKVIRHEWSNNPSRTTNISEKCFQIFNPTSRIPVLPV